MLNISKLFNGRDLEEDNNFSELKKSTKKIKSQKFQNSKSKNSDYKRDSNQILEPETHSLHFRRENRKGKTVTMVGFFYISENDKSELLKSIKKTVSTGGTIREDYLEFQGDNEKRLKEEFIKRGFKFKR